MFEIGGLEILMVLLVAVIFIGPKSIPDVVRTLVGLKRKYNEMMDDVKSSVSVGISEIEEINRLTSLDDKKKKELPAPQKTSDSDNSNNSTSEQNSTNSAMIDTSANATSHNNNNDEQHHNSNDNENKAHENTNKQ